MSRLPIGCLHVRLRCLHTERTCLQCLYAERLSIMPARQECVCNACALICSVSTLPARQECVCNACRTHSPELPPAPSRAQPVAISRGGGVHDLVIDWFSQLIKPLVLAPSLVSHVYPLY
jgi:hypothetical protein